MKFSALGGTVKSTTIHKDRIPIGFSLVLYQHLADESVWERRKKKEGQQQKDIIWQVFNRPRVHWE